MVPSARSFLSFAGGVLRLSESAIKVANPRDRSNQMHSEKTVTGSEASGRESLEVSPHVQILQTLVISWKLLQENFTQTWTSIVADATSGRSSVLTINFDRCHSIDVNCSDPTPDTLECYNFHVQILSSLSNILRCGQNPLVPGNHIGREWMLRIPVLTYFDPWHHEIIILANVGSSSHGLASSAAAVSPTSLEN